jgi:hypothetical protein
MKLLRDTADPIMATSKSDNDDPIRAMPKSANDEPRREKLRNDIEAPK